MDTVSLRWFKNQRNLRNANPNFQQKANKLTDDGLGKRYFNYLTGRIQNN